MKIGMVGLGRMGMNMSRRLLRGGHQVAAWNRSLDKTEELGREGGEVCHSLAELVAKLARAQGGLADAASRGGGGGVSGRTARTVAGWLADY